MAAICNLPCNTKGLVASQRTASIKPFTNVRSSRTVVKALASQQEVQGLQATRRQLLQMATLPALAAVLPEAALAAKGPRGFNVVADQSDNYQFLYPFGWQEVAVTGTDVVYKDVIEPLESVSVTMTKTDKKDIIEFGDIKEVCDTLAKEVLTAPGQQAEVLSTNQRELKGHNYYEFEFLVKTPRYTRHSSAVVAANDGTFYTLTTGASEKRWGKMKDKLSTVVRSFSFIN